MSLDEGQIEGLTYLYRRTEIESWLDQQGKEAVAIAVKELAEDLATLPQADDFIAYVSCYPEEEDVEKSLMQQTVSQPLLDRLFPNQW